jgi:hypothetical protein
MASGDEAAGYEEKANEDLEENCLDQSQTYASGSRCKQRLRGAVNDRIGIDHFLEEDVHALVGSFEDLPNRPSGQFEIDILLSA